MYLTERYLRSWISSFGLDVSRIRSLALSFTADPTVYVEDASSTIAVAQAVTAAQAMTAVPVLSQHTQQAYATYMLSPQRASQAGFVNNAVTTIVLQQPTQQLPTPIPLVSSTPVPSTPNSTGSDPPASPARTAAEEAQAAEEFAWLALVTRMSSWGFSAATPDEVDRWIVRKNTDLRAGRRWLLFVSGATRQRAGLGMRY